MEGIQIVSLRNPVTTGAMLPRRKERIASTANEGESYCKFDWPPVTTILRVAP